MPLLASLLVVILVANGSSPLSYGPDRKTTQAATPSVTFPETPSPTECTLKPRAAEPLLGLLGTPSDEAIYAPEVEPIVVSVPVGQPADSEIQIAITATVREHFACFNAGDVRRAFALVTDDFLRRFAAEGSLTAQDIAFFMAEPEPVPVADRTTLLAITDVSVLATGRAGAFVVTDDRFNNADTVYMIFVQQGDRWLIEEIIEFL